MDEPESPIDGLKRVNAQLRHQFEVSEAILPPINQLVQQLVGLGFGEIVILGKVLHERAYLPGLGPIDTAQLCQAALVVGRGVGVIHWDNEHYLALEHSPEGPESEALVRFVGFEDCGVAIKALLLPEVWPMLEQLVKQFPRV